MPRARLGFVIQAARGWERAVAFLLQSDEPAIRFLARRDLLDEDGPEDTPTILSGPRVSALLTGQRPGEFHSGHGWRSLPGAEFGFGVGAYRNWTGAHWRLVSLRSSGFRRWSSERAWQPSRCSAGWPDRSGSVRCP